MKKFKLGPIQEAWLKSLEENPDRQRGGKLAEFNPNDKDDYKACCLGELILTKHRLEGTKPIIKQNKLYSNEKYDAIIEDYGLNGVMIENYQDYGLDAAMGVIKDGFKWNNIIYFSLARLNDVGCPWPEIARLIRANPEKVFNKSL